MSVRVRFAPSPTGFLHIGGARTALFNWLYARHTGGTFVLRIEDTDMVRNTRESTHVILEGLKWLGIDWDEGPLQGDPAAPGKGEQGPYFQSARHEIYRTRVNELMEKGMAYEQEGAIRFRMTREPVTIQDLVVGEVKRELTDREAMDPDFVIVRSDGQPVFHLVNVVDDLEMGITHVIRGEDHLSNTSRHIALFRAFDIPPPRYAHIPLILNQDGTKMSKRDTGSSLGRYMEEGYAPEAVANFLCLLGWSPKGDREILSMDEIVRLFDLQRILRHNARFDMAKLQWMNAEYIRTMPMRRYVGLATEALAKEGIRTDDFDPAYVDAALATCRERLKVFSDAPKFAAFYFAEEVLYQSEALEKHKGEEGRRKIGRIRNTMKSLREWNAASIESSMKSLASEMGTKVGALVHPTRFACTGTTVGPSLYHLMEVLGKERVLRRLDRASEIL